MNRFIVRCLLGLVLMGLLPMVAKADDPDALLGRWLSAKKRNQVLIYKQGNRYFGKLIWMVEPNDPVTQKPKLDKRNPDERLRARPLLNMPIMVNLVRKGENAWGDGQIYNPEDGKTYGCELSLKDANTLHVRGYLGGFTFLGKTTTWTRVP